MGHRRGGRAKQGRNSGIAEGWDMGQAVSSRAGILMQTVGKLQAEAHGAAMQGNNTNF